MSNMVRSVENFVYTTAIRKLRKLRKKIRVIPGGTSAGKTYGILPILIDRAARNAGTEISVVSETIPHLRRGAMKDFIKIMKATYRWFEQDWNRTFLKYQFPNGSYIEFFSADQDSKLRGARRNILYINECNNISFEAYQQLAIRTSNEIWIDFNPSNEFWAHQELAHDPDAEWLTLTYKDNEALSGSIVKEIEKAKQKALTSKYWENWWKVYGLGQLGMLQGVIFQDWTQIDKIPHNAQLLGYGLDFGKGGQDPTALCAIYSYDGQHIWHGLIYQSQLLDRELIDLMKSKGVDNRLKIYCDNSEPSKIRELQLAGFHAVGEKKETIDYGLGLMLQEKVLVTSSSLDLVKELRNYRYEDNARPVDAFNHYIDGIRYFYVGKFGAKNQKNLSYSFEFW